MCTDGPSPSRPCLPSNTPSPQRLRPLQRLCGRFRLQHLHGGHGRYSGPAVPRVGQRGGGGGAGWLAGCITGPIAACPEQGQGCRGAGGGAPRVCPAALTQTRALPPTCRRHTGMLTSGCLPRPLPSSKTTHPMPRSFAPKIWQLPCPSPRKCGLGVEGRGAMEGGNRGRVLSVGRRLAFIGTHPLSRQRNRSDEFTTATTIDTIINYLIAICVGAVVIRCAAAADG